MYPGQNQIYPGQQPEFGLYPAPLDPAYPSSGNIYGYPNQQFTYPDKKNKEKTPQVTTSVPETVSTEIPEPIIKSNETPTEDTGKHDVIDIRLNLPKVPEIANGQRAVILSKNELLAPSSGSSGHSSSLTPQYLNSPTKESTKIPYKTVPDQSNIIVVSSSKPESSTPIYSLSTRAESQPESSYSGEPESTVSNENQFSTAAPDSSTPVNIIPYPLPIVPNPGSCPCYFVPPTNNSTIQAQQQQQQQPTFDLNNLPEGAVIGFIPVVFYPSCSGASKELLSSKLEPIFPSAYQVPYKCSYCEQSESQTARIKSSSFDQVVKQSQLNPSVVIKSPSRKIYPNAPIYDQPEFGRKIKVVRRKSKDEQNYN